MAQVKTNNVSLSYSIETALGVAGTTWRVVEPNSISNLGATISTVERNPISKNRQRSKGTITDLDSAVEFEADLTGDHFLDFTEGFMFARFTDILSWGPLDTDPVTPFSARNVTDVTATGYTVTQDGDVAINTLVFARAFTNSANNGLKVAVTGSTATEVKASGLVLEATPPDEARLDVCGIQGATGDIEMDASGNLISTTLVFTTLGLTAGQFIKIGGTATDTSFANETANNDYARVVSVAANLITLDKRGGTFAVDDGALKTIQLFFGRFGRNVGVDSVEYIERTFQFEALYPDLEAVGTDAYEYSIGNFCNQLQLNLPLTDKATIGYGFIGTDTEAPVTVRKTRTLEIDPFQIEAFNTTADIARLQITDTDETELSTYFKTLTMTLNNNVSPEKVIGVLGAAFVNNGNFNVDIEAQLLFTKKEIAARIRANTTVTMDTILVNDEGAIAIDIPAMTLGGGDKEYPENETVLINTPAIAFRDPTLNASIGISYFPHIPQA